MPATNELLQEGRYRINQQIPLTGNGNVYEAYDTVRDTNVVVKEIIVKLNRVTTMSQQEALKTEFASQAKILAAIEHDSLLHVHDYFSEIGRQYLVLESIDGDDLAQLLERNRSAFAVTDVVEWADQLLDALNYLHTFQPPIIHRNVRPHHIKLSSAGKIKLLAFGLTDSDEARLNTTLDESIEVGINYSPLELIWEGLDAASQKVISNSYDDRSARLLKEPADARSDIYSLAATLYHLVTGNVPVDPLERSIELLDGKADPLKPPHKVDSRIPVELSEVLMRALEIKRENRFDSAVIMRQVVRTAMVRVREREAEEAREHDEAAEDIRLAEQMRLAQSSRRAEQEKLEADAAQLRETELLKEQRLLEEQREAEVKRLFEEREAVATLEQERAEAARAEAEAAKAEAASAATAADLARAEADAALLLLQEDLLEIDVESVDVKELTLDYEVVSDSPNSEFIEHFSNDIVADDNTVISADVSDYEAAVIAEHSEAHELKPASLSNPEELELGGVFSEASVGHRSGIRMPMVAGIAAVILIVAVAGWFVMSPGPKAPQPVPQTVSSAQVPAQETAQPASIAVEAGGQPATVTDEAAVEIEGRQQPSLQRQSTQPPPAKSKKPATQPTKAAAETKKAVTVDDLINDN